MTAPIITATTPTAGYSLHPIAASGIGAAAAAPDTVIAVAVWCR
jgi:hypothetical protein